MDAVSYLYATAPKKLLYVGLGMTWELLQLPFWCLYFLLPSLRQHKSWSLRQAISVRLFKAALYYMTKAEILFPTHLYPAAEGDRFRVINPAPTSTYQGPLDHKSIKPATIGGTWFPTPYPTYNPKRSSEKVILHVHGGAFIYGNGRDIDAGVYSNWLVTEGGFDRVFAVQYRLAGKPGGESFPAAAQDIVTAYRFLVQQLRIPANNIVLSGDSAGGNLAVMLLRYIAEHGATANLPTPSAALLWSPWVDVGVNVDVNYFHRTPQYKLDVLNGLFGNWGMRSYAADTDPMHPYITPRGHPFRTATPIYLQCGDSEVLFHEDVAFAKEMTEVGSNVELWVEEAAVHDVLGLGQVLGFSEKAKQCIARAGEWYRNL